MEGGVTPATQQKRIGLARCPTPKISAVTESEVIKGP